jgi:hypothetical protein
MGLRWQTAMATTPNQCRNQNALRSDGPKRFRFLFSPEGSPKNSINLVGGSKIKFIVQFHFGKALVFSDTEKKTIGKTHNVKTSAARQAWKREIDSIGQDLGFIAGSQ